MNDILDPNDHLHDDLASDGGGNDGQTDLPPIQMTESAFQGILIHTRPQFELLAALAALSGVRSKKDMPLIFERAEQLADHYEDRGFFSDGEPLRLEQVGFVTEDLEPPIPQAPAPTRTRDGKNVRVVGGEGSMGIEPAQLARNTGKKTVQVVAGRPKQTTFVGRAVVNATNGSHRPGSNSAQAGPVRTISRQPPPARSR